MNGAETRDTWPPDLPAPTSHLLSLLCRIMQMAPSQPELLTIWLIAVLCLMSGLCQVMWVLQAADGTYKIETRYVDGRVKGRQDMNNNWTDWIDHFRQIRLLWPRGSAERGKLRRRGWERLRASNQVSSWTGKELKTFAITIHER